MLPRRNRLSRRHIKPVFENGAVFRGRLFLLRIASGSESGTAEISVSVPKKALKLAVERNKARRRAYSALSRLIASANPCRGLLTLKPGSGVPEFADAERDISDLLRTAKAIPGAL